MDPSSLPLDPRRVREVLVAAAGGARPWVAAFARFGFVAKGIVYLMVGGWALAAALRWGGFITDAPGAIVRLATTPIGRASLVLVALGLVGYSALRLVQGTLDPERRGLSAFMITVRFGEVLNAAGHALLAFGAFKILTGGRPPPAGDAGTRMLTREALALPYGDGLLGLLGAIVAVVGISLLVRGFAGQNVCGDLRLDAFSPAFCRFVGATIRFGRVAQGIIMAMIGWFLVLAAWDRSPTEAQGPAGALRALARFDHGRLWVAIIAAGLIAVALSCFFDALWRRYPRISD